MHAAVTWTCAKDAMDHGVLCKGPMEMLEVCHNAKLELVCLLQKHVHLFPRWLTAGMGGWVSTPAKPQEEAPEEPEEEAPLPPQEQAPLEPEEEAPEEAPGAVEAEDEGWEGEEEEEEEKPKVKDEEALVLEPLKPKAKGKHKKKCGSTKERKRLKEKNVRKELEQKQKKSKGKKGRSSKIKGQEDLESAAYKEVKRARKRKPPSSSNSSSSSSSDSSEESNDPRNTSRLRRLFRRQLQQGTELLAMAKRPMLQPQPKWASKELASKELPMRLPPGALPKTGALPKRLPPGAQVIDLTKIMVDPKPQEEGEGKKRKKPSYSPEEWAAWEQEQKKKNGEEGSCRGSRKEHEATSG